jgi:hypothetical protein
MRPERFELPTFWFVARRSIQLSYERTVRFPWYFNEKRRVRILSCESRRAKLIGQSGVRYSRVVPRLVICFNCSAALMFPPPAETSRPGVRISPGAPLFSRCPKQYGPAIRADVLSAARDRLRSAECRRELTPDPSEPQRLRPTLVRPTTSDFPGRR